MLLDNFDKNNIIHMIGIGGSSMSGIAEILINMGYKVTGSNNVSSNVTKRLEESGIKVYEGHFAENVESASLIIYTAAIKPDNPELVHAKELSIPCLERADFLGELTKIYSETIAVSGTHGKTTTTSMISIAFVNGNKNPSVQVGADIKQLNGKNFRVGDKPYFIIEACEYVESFLKFHPKTAIILNIEEDHLDYYKDLNHIKSAFTKFVNLVPNTGFIIANADDTNCLDVIKDSQANLITFGINNPMADWIATNIVLNDDGYYSFTAVRNEEKIDIKLHVFGYHNIYNALATIATARAHNIETSAISSALLDFTGASRRFEYVGEFNGAKIYDDYAHHPTEIKACLNSAKSIPHNKLWVVFQPHTYSRTASLFDEFSKSFKQADNLILTDIYAAREVDDKRVSSQQLAIAINEISNNCTYISKTDDIIKYLKENIKPNDLVLTIGAGDITNLGYKLRA